MKTQYYLFILIISLYACNIIHEDHDEINMALNLAGKNRHELEAVLSHYASEPQKLEAAKFLIRNMPGHYSYADTVILTRYSAAVDSILTAMSNTSMYERKDSINSCAEKLGIAQVKKIQDIHVITSDYLIRNIDNAFEAWNGPWARHLSFEQFCEYLLPYKVGELQLLDDWRNRLKGFHTEVLNDMDKCDAYRNATLEAARRLSKSLGAYVHPNYNSVVNFPVMRFEVNARVPCGSCDYYIPLALAVHRSNGIPLTHDFCPHWASRRLGHSWNAVLAENGRTMAFNGVSENPVMATNGISVSDGDMHNSMEKMAKVYRHTYARNKELSELNRKEKNVPPLLRNVFMKDVTTSYMETSDISVHLRNVPRGVSYAYLAIYGDNDWYPVTFAKIEKGKAIFQNMGRNIMYIVLCYSPDGTRHMLSEPLLLGFDGNVKTFAPSEKRTTMRLTRKYPILEYVYKWLSCVDNCEFQASNDNNFHRYSTIHITSGTKATGNELDIPEPTPPFRFWRFIPLKENSRGNIAEIYFYDSNGKKICGRVIGTEGSFENRANRTREAAFDGNTLTYFESPDGKTPWVGMDFGYPVKLSSIIYYPRGDGNSVELGDEYELFYWDDDNWQSIGKKRAQSHWIEFAAVPEGTIYLLRDITKGHEERIFTYDDSMQTWW
ncbi:MAG: discoidin domain-containing protein [Prevotella sp.]|nr:discoidin domain-containing protein [Prevotella sp.]